MNSTGQHWVTVTSIGCPVGKIKVNDSGYRSVLRRMRDIHYEDYSLPFDPHRSYFARNAARAQWKWLWIVYHCISHCSGKLDRAK